MSDRLDVVTTGELLGVIAPFQLDSSLEGTVLLEKSVGGSEVNVALTLARLGHRIGWMGVVGDDPFGREGVRTLRAEGVDVSRVIVDPSASTGIYLKEMTPLGGVRNYAYREGSAASRATYADMDVSYASSARVLHLTGITAAISDSGQDLVTQLMTAQANTGVHLSFDVNVRRRLMRGLDPATLLRPLCDLADTIFSTPEEARMLYSTDSPPALQSMLSAMRATTVVLHDAAGVVAVTVHEIAEVGARPLKVIDPTGAGDAVVAGYLSGWLDDLPLSRRLRRAEYCAALAVGSRGDSPVMVSRSELVADGDDR